jgi:acyl-CoA thioester hydrolase
MTALTYAGAVYPWQCDHMGHMNVTGYVAKFDEATWAFFLSIGLTPAVLRGDVLGMAALEQRITYKRELMPGDVVEISTRLVELREKTVRFVHTMCNRETGELAAECELIAACLDKAARKARPFPRAIAERARAVQAEVAP